MQGNGWRLNLRTIRLILVVIAALVAAYFGPKHIHRGNPGGPLPAQLSGAARPIDGDSLYVGAEEVRLKDIDAPEGRQSCRRDGRDWACGDAALDELRRLISGRNVTCRAIERDKHGRVLAYCSADGRDLNRDMVAGGFAVSFGGYAYEEADARRGRRGIWGSEFERPQQWRHERGIGM
jgi:endonuclease YncB( thermonuclease family)